MKLIASVTLITLVLALGVRAQGPTTATTKHFYMDGLEFDYPAEWTLTEKNAEKVNNSTLTAADGFTQVSIMDQSQRVSPCNQAESKAVTADILERIAPRIHTAAPFQTTELQIGSTSSDGFELHGTLNKQPVTVGVYSLQLKPRFVNVVYLRHDNDQSAETAWEMIRTTMKIKLATEPGSWAPISGGVLNGKAIHLVQPGYPRSGPHVSGTVVVQVVIDESGKVIAAHAVSGHPLLQPGSVAAAFESKFSPTKLCSHPIKVTGVIQYNFRLGAN